MAEAKNTKKAPKKTAKKRAPAKKKGTKRPAKKAPAKKAPEQESDVKLAVKSGKRKRRWSVYLWAVLILLLAGFVAGYAVGREGTSVKFGGELSTQEDLITSLRADNVQLEAELAAAEALANQDALEKAMAQLNGYTQDACERLRLVTLPTPLTSVPDMYFFHLTDTDTYLPLASRQDQMKEYIGQRGCNFYFEDLTKEGPNNEERIIAFSADSRAWSVTDVPGFSFQQLYRRAMIDPGTEASDEERAAWDSVYESFLEDQFLALNDEGLWLMDRSTLDPQLIISDLPEGISLSVGLGDDGRVNRGLAAPGWEGFPVLTMEAYNEAAGTIRFRIYSVTENENGGRTHEATLDSVTYQLP